MSFYRRIQYFLVHTLMLSNKSAAALIQGGKIEIDGQVVSENCFLEDHSEIKVNGNVVRPAKEFVYLKFHKPKGFESTLNKQVRDNISRFFDQYQDLAIAGRLDKHSEGLMLISNDGKWVEQMCNPKFEKEKEYLVTLDREPDEQFFLDFQNGVSIGRHFTAPCTCYKVEQTLINVVLKEGKNRQIRKMCKTLGYEVTRLKRIRIDHFLLNDLPAGSTETTAI